MNISKKLLVFIFAVAVTGIVNESAKAQSGHFSAESLSMGGTGAAYLNTYHANFINPANLMVKRYGQPSFSVGLLGGISAFAGGPLYNVSAYNSHFTSGNTVNSTQALNDWFGTDTSNMNKLGLEVDVIPIGLAWRGEKMSFSLAMRNRTMVSTSMTRGYANLLLSGISQEDFSEPTPVDFSSKMVMFSEISAGFAYEIMDRQEFLGYDDNVRIFVGIAPKYIVPHYTSSFDLNSTLQVTDNEVVHDFQYTLQTVGSLTSQFRDYYNASQQNNFDGSLTDFIEPDGADFTEIQGSGFGVDLGVTVEMDMEGNFDRSIKVTREEKLRFSLSVSDIGAVTYDNNAGSFSNNDTFTWDGVDIENGFNDALADSISNDIYLNYQPGSKEKITQQLPTKIHLGSQLQYGKWSFALDLTQGLNSVGMNSTRPIVGLGAEYDLLKIIPLRAGFRTGGLTASSFTFGTGLDITNFEFSVGAMVVPNSDKRGSGMGGAWSGLVFRF